MDMITAIAFYLLGVFSGITGIIALTLFMSKRALDKRKKELEASGIKKESIKSRMNKVREMTAEQLELNSAADGPQKNALHGRYKNGLIGRIKELEIQKADVLRSIIADGFDPEITVVDGAGVVTTIKLSEFLAQTGALPPTEPPKSIKPRTKLVGKFTVHKGGKDDGGSTTH